MQSRETLFRGLFDEGHVFGEMLLGVDFAFVAPLLLGEPEGRDRGTVLLVEFLPYLHASSLSGRRVFVAGWISGEGDRTAECERQPHSDENVHIGLSHRLNAQSAPEDCFSFPLHLHRVVDVLKCLVSDLTGAPASVFDDVVQAGGIFDKSRSCLPHGLHPFDDAVGDELFAIDAPDRRSPAFLVDLLLDGGRGKDFVEIVNRADVRVARVVPADARRICNHGLQFLANDRFRV